MTTEPTTEVFEHDLGPNALKAVAFCCATILGTAAACLDGQVAIMAIVALAGGIAGITGYAVKKV
jgi:butyrate kinase